MSPDERQGLSGTLPATSGKGNNHYSSQNTKDSSGQAQSHAARHSAKHADSIKKGPVASIVSASAESELGLTSAAPPAAAHGVKAGAGPTKDLAKKHSGVTSEHLDSLNGGGSIHQSPTKAKRQVSVKHSLNAEDFSPKGARQPVASANKGLPHSLDASNGVTGAPSVAGSPRGANGQLTSSIDQSREHQIQVTLPQIGSVGP